MIYIFSKGFYFNRRSVLSVLSMLLACCSVIEYSWARNPQIDLYVETVTLNWPDPSNPGEAPSNSNLNVDVIIGHRFELDSSKDIPPNRNNDAGNVDVWVTALQLPGGVSEVVLKQSAQIAMNATTRFNLAIPIPSGTYAMLMEVDPEDQVQETNENNNRYQFLATGKPVEISSEQRMEVIERLLAMNPKMWVDGESHTLGIPVKADLVVNMDNFISDQHLPGFFHYSIKINNAGPDKMPKSLLSRLSVIAGFMDSAEVCIANLSGLGNSLSDLEVGNNIEIDMYIQSTSDRSGKCRSALLPQRDDPMSEEKIYFIGGKIPASSISIDTQSAQNVIPGTFDYVLIDNNQQNNKKEVSQRP